MLYQYEDPLRSVKASPVRRRARRVRILFPVSAFVVGLVVAGWYLRGDALEPLTQASLDLASSRWRASGIQDYDLQLQMNAVEYDVEVRSGIVTQVQVNGLDAPSNTWRNYSVDGLLATLEMELDNVSDPERSLAARGLTVLTRVRFHPGWGYPERYLRSAGPMGKAAVIEVRVFRPLSKPA